MAYKRILTIQDISCVGQCSMTVALPILSACGHETCILPTAVLSTHTGGFGKPAVRHLHDAIASMAEHWISQNITFDAILVGYLGNIETIAIVKNLLPKLLAPGGISIVDPAMADHGRLYTGFDENYCSAMTRLCADADIILPNITEAAMMAGLPCPQSTDTETVRTVLELLGGREIVLTGVSDTPGLTGVAIRRNGQLQFISHERLEKSFHGTGDMFAACFTGALMQGLCIGEAAALAGEFTLRSIRATMAAPAHWYGVKFETQLPWLAAQLRKQESGGER